MTITITDLNKSNVKYHFYPSHTYWNNPNKEKNKVFNVADLGFDKIENSNKYNNLISQINLYCRKLNIDFKKSNILSIGSGSCYIESRWLQNKSFLNLTCIDFSHHRIHKLAPLSFQKYLNDELNIDLICGNFDDFEKETKKKFDIVLLSQSFHHFDEPLRLLRKLTRVLSNKATIIIVGEPYHNNYQYHKGAIKHFIKYIFNINGYKKNRNLYPNWSDIFKNDEEKGDFHWSKIEYLNFFQKSNYKIFDWQIHKQNSTQSFLLKYEK